MGLFLSPFSGHAVGGGGHGIIDPPPPGTDPGSGPRSEVDTVNRTPLRLLRTTMNKHRPKFMKVVPPGQQRGSIAPPYAWDALERDDWKYALPKPRGLKETTYRDSTEVLPPHDKFKPLDKERNPSPHGPSRRGDTRRLRRPKSPGDEDILGPKTPPAPPRPDPRKARVDSIKQQIDKLKMEIRQLVAKRHELVQAGKSSLGMPTSPQIESIRARIREIISEADYDPESHVRQESPEEWEARQKHYVRGPADDHPGSMWLHKLMKRRMDPNAEPLGLSRNPIPSISSRRRRERKQQRQAAFASRDPSAPPRPTRGSPSQTAEILSITNQLRQKHAEVDNLTRELEMLTQQIKAAKTESVRLSSNNLRRIGLLLK